MHTKLTSPHFAPLPLLLLTFGASACSSAPSRDGWSQEDALAESSALVEDCARSAGKAQPLEATREYDVIRFAENGADPCGPIEGRTGSWAPEQSQLCETSDAEKDSRGTPHLCVYAWRAAGTRRSVPEVEHLTAIPGAYVAALDPTTSQPLLVRVALMQTAEVAACSFGSHKVLPSTGSCDVCGARVGHVKAREMVVPAQSAVSVVSVGLANGARYIVPLPERGADSSEATQERFLLPPAPRGIAYDEGPVRGFAQTRTAP
jgi:hypothetical protein